MKAKRILICLGVAITSILAMVVGILTFNKGGDKHPPVFVPPNNQGEISSEFKPTTYYFDEGEVNVARGSENLVYSYDINQKSTAPIAYEYIFSNANNKDMAVNVKEVEAEGATVSYYWSDVEKDEITESTNYFITQPISRNATKYLYVVLEPEDANESITINATVRWNYGVAGTLTKLNTFTHLPFTQTYIKGMQIQEEEMLLPTVEDGCVFAGWYWDEYYTQPVTFPIQYKDQPMYARIGSYLPDDWYGSGTYKGYYGVAKVGTDISTLKSKDIIIPEVHNGNNVKIICETLTGATNVKIPDTVEVIINGFSGNADIKWVYLHKNIKKIQDAFKDCTNLEQVIFEEGSQLEYIYRGFEGCTKLTSITLPKKLTQIVNSAFKGCTNLTSITLPSELTYIDWYIFEECSSLTSITIPAGVTKIFGRAFRGCSELTSVTFEEGSQLKEIGYSAFEGCTKLTNIILPSTVTDIGGNAFMECKSLVSLKIPDGVTSLKGNTFSDCTSLIDIDLPSGLTSIGSNIFNGCVNLLEVTIPKGLKEIAYGMVSRCSNLGKVTFEEGSQLETIGGNAFLLCNKLAYINIPDTVTSIGLQAFSNCTSLTEINIPSGVTAIETSAFYSCENLRNVTIPHKVTSIGNNAFRDCKSLDVDIPASVTSIGDWAFSGTAIDNLEISNKVEYLGEYAFCSCNKLTNVIFEEGSPLTTISRGLFQNSDAITSVIMLDSITSIGDYAFYSCDSLSNIILPGDLISIGDAAFADVRGITSIEIPAKVTSMAEGLFHGCSNLTSIHVDEDNPIFYSINNAIIKIDGANRILIAACNGTSEIPAEVTRIGDNAFRDCIKLTSITIPEGVTSIGESAFRGCSNLTSATFANPSGWTAGSTALSSSDLANSSTAATYLRSTYYKSMWTRS